MGTSVYIRLIIAWLMHVCRSEERTLQIAYVLLLYVLLGLYQSVVVLKPRVSGISTRQDTNNLIFCLKRVEKRGVCQSPWSEFLVLSILALDSQSHVSSTGADGYHQVFALTPAGQILTF